MNATRRGTIGSAVGSAVLAAGLLACGGSDKGPHFNLPEPVPATGHVVCSSTVSPNSFLVPQGGSIIVTYTLWDVNLLSFGRFLPVSFEQEGGFIADAPTLTDNDGRVAVRFVARTDYVGPGSVRLIQPDSELICDVDFTIARAQCLLELQVLDQAGDVVVPYDACGHVVNPLERHLARRYVFRVSRQHPVTGEFVPAPGSLVRLTATGFNFGTMVIGPANIAGEVEAGDLDGDPTIEQPVAPIAGFLGPATLTGTVEAVDVNDDGAPDNLSCGSCTLTSIVVDPFCDDHLEVLTPIYRDANGIAKAAPLRPGESADVLGFVVVDGVPQAGIPVLVTAEEGILTHEASGRSGRSLLIDTAINGALVVTYRPDPGFSGLDTVTFRTSNDITCIQTATIEVVTCDFEVVFDPEELVAGGENEVTFTLVPGSVDPDEVEGLRVVLDSTRGFFTPPGPMIRELDAAGSFTATFNPSSPGIGTISVSFLDGFPCATVTESFTVLEP